MSKRALDPKRIYVGAAFTALLASLVWVALGHNPLITEPALSFVPGRALVAISLALGVALAVLTIRVTRQLAERVEWGRELAQSLRVRLAGATTGEILRTALLVGVTEEVFFRGILQPLVGVWLAALAFGVLHVGQGRTRVYYAAWAALTGVSFGAIFWLTGSIAGPIVAHVVINAANAVYLRDQGKQPRRRRALGGLLSR